ncbi:hypothetical protein [Aquimarina rubra]|uniref:Uncharacterized protein n=1 Tax=Aquimarina rubra TaxID=1920033 RepID=A0ABW5LN72_9FLAO
MSINTFIPQQNGRTIKTKDGKKVKNQIDYWKTKINSRKCQEFSEMSYWEVVCTSNAL